MMGLRAALAVVVVSLLASATVATADDPKGALESAVRSTAAAKTARIAVTQRVTSGGRTSESNAAGVLSAGDHDLRLSGENGGTRRVAVGTTVKERRPDAPDQPWRQSARTPPGQTTALGPLKLKDGTSIGDPKLYKSVTDQGLAALAPGSLRKIVGELDMDAVAAAMQLSDQDRARMAGWGGTLVVWIDASGRVAKNAVVLVISGADGPTTLEAEVDLSDLDAPLAVTLP